MPMVIELKCTEYEEEEKKGKKNKKRERENNDSCQIVIS